MTASIRVCGLVCAHPHRCNLLGQQGLRSFQNVCMTISIGFLLRCQATLSCEDARQSPPPHPQTTTQHTLWAPQLLPELATQ